MKIIYYDDYKETTCSKNIEGDEDFIFESLFKINNSLRYCNGSYWKPEDLNDEKRYYEWKKNLSRDRHFNLYYGANGIVD
jgi:hypothetical protein